MKAKITNLMSLPVDTVHEVRFLPNHKQPSESITMIEKYLDPSGDECSSGEFAIWRQMGEKSVHHMVRYHSNAILNGVPTVLFYTRTMKKVIDALLSGTGEIDGEALIMIEQVNPFDLRSDVSVQFRIENVPGVPFKRMKVLGIIKNEKNVLYKDPAPEELFTVAEQRKANFMEFMEHHFGSAKEQV